MVTVPRAAEKIHCVLVLSIKALGQCVEVLDDF